MNLSARIAKLETLSIFKKDGPHIEALEQDLRDWILNDPKAAELLTAEYKYCTSKGYPTMGKESMQFYECLDDPVLKNMGDKTLVAFDKYLKARKVI